jgi:hypothetical protein
MDRRIPCSIAAPEATASRTTSATRTRSPIPAHAGSPAAIALRQRSSHAGLVASNPARRPGAATMAFAARRRSSSSSKCKESPTSSGPSNRSRRSPSPSRPHGNCS